MGPKRRQTTGPGREAETTVGGTGHGGAAATGHNTAAARNNNARALRVGTSLQKSRKMYELTVPKKGGPGKQGKDGKPMLVHANYLPIKFQKNHKPVNHYDVQVKAPWSRGNKRSDAPLFRKGFNILRTKYAKVLPPYAAYDGINNMYTTQQLGHKGEKWVGEVEVQETEYSEALITLKFTLKLVRTNIDISGSVAGFIAGHLQNIYT